MSTTTMKVTVSCQLCTGVMTARTNKSSNNKFYGCSNYPGCQHTMMTGEYKRKQHEKGCSMVGEHPYTDEYDLDGF